MRKATLYKDNNKNKQRNTHKHRHAENFCLTTIEDPMSVGCLDGLSLSSVFVVAAAAAVVIVVARTLSRPSVSTSAHS